jgi:hypothetical protein
MISLSIFEDEEVFYYEDDISAKEKAEIESSRLQSQDEQCRR